jgi:hypothetical protein
MVDFSRNTERAILAAKRYEGFAGTPRGYKRMNLVMDLTAADGVNGNRPLDWDRLLSADDFNFMHDIAGISRHINRETGELEGHFLPRFTRKLTEA